MTEGIEQFIAENRERIDNALEKILQTTDPMRDAARYSVLGTGHRYRPLITIASSEMYHVPLEKILPIACAVELVHNASIIIDDSPSFDNGTLRRGKPTLHLVYGEASVMPTAGHLEYLAYSLLTGDEIPGQERQQVLLMVKMSETIFELIRGEWTDMESKNRSMSVDEILSMYGQKSGALYAYSAIAGGIAGQASYANIGHLARYGRQMGTAYQILDDISDVEASSEQVGKDVGQDVGKPTLPSVLGVELSRKQAEHFMDNAKHELTHINRDTGMLRALVDYIAFIGQGRTDNQLLT